MKLYVGLSLKFGGCFVYEETRQVGFFETGFGEATAELKNDGAHEGLQSCTYHSLVGEWELLS